MSLSPLIALKKVTPGCSMEPGKPVRTSRTSEGVNLYFLHPSTHSITLSFSTHFLKIVIKMRTFPKLFRGQ